MEERGETMKQIGPASALRVTAVYLLFSAIWIFVTDYVLSLVLDDVQSFWYLSTGKGLAFVLVSGFVIYRLVHHEVRLWSNAQQSIHVLEEYDVLTGLYNRSRFVMELAQLEQQKLDISIVISDINGLRLVNEIYSTQTGDALLRRYADMLRETMPEDAFISRIGGDEFCVLIPSCDEALLEITIHNLEQQIAQQDIKEFALTVAIGTSCSCDDHQSLIELVALAEDRMQQKKLLLDESASNSVITSLKTSMFERSDETEQHADRMQALCVKLGESLHLSGSEINELRLFAILHDIGKIGISDAILNKPGRLTPAEYNKMKQHSMIGYKIASNVAPLEAIAYLILTHHERWDGKGYPNGLKGTDIPLAARILAVIDAYDAMTNDRVYRKAMSHEAALKELLDNKGTQFDPAMVDLFFQLFEEQVAL